LLLLLLVLLLLLHLSMRVQAGSGKTTLMNRLQESLQQQQQQTTTKPSPPIPEENASSGKPPAVRKEVEEQGGGDDNHDGDDDNSGDDDAAVDRFYCLNLDPATIHVPFECNIDIRDTVNYSQVMERHQLGPNGAIMTCLNLFATKFDQVLEILERRAYGTTTSGATEGDGEEEAQGAAATAATTATDEDPHPASSSNSNRNRLEYILVDTPGQIEAFTWSASGTIVCQSLASSFPTVICFVVDTARCASSPNTFMSNMLYACSILYRTHLPLVVCFNKADVVSHQFCLEWMRDHEAFQAALDDAAAASAADSSGSGYYGSLTRSLSLVLDEFYSNFANAVGVSAVTGQGMAEFWDAVQTAATSDFDEYVDDLKLRSEEQQARAQAVARQGVARLQRDLQQHQQGNGAANGH
jgi:GPN-loop GTPase